MKSSLIGIFFLLLLVNCSTGPKLDTARAKKINNIAIVAFNIDQQATGGIFQDSDLAQKEISQGLVGTTVSMGQVIYGDYANKIFDDASQLVESELSWESMPRSKMLESSHYRIIERNLSRSMWSSKAGAEKGYLRYGIKKMIFANQMYNQAPKYEKMRDKLIKKLGVDAIAVLTVRYKLPIGGISTNLGSLGRFGSGDFEPEVDVSMMIYDKQGFVGEIVAKGDAEKSYKKEELKEGLVKVFRTKFSEKLREVKKTL